MSNSMQPHGLQHSRLPCPWPTPGACSNACPLSRWCHPTISSSVVPFSSHLQSFPASGSFPVSQFFPSGGQSIGASASASVLPVNIQDWFLLGLTGLGWKQMGSWLPTLSYWIPQCTLGIHNREKQNTGLIKLRCVAKQWIQWAQILANSHI